MDKIGRNSLAVFALSLILGGVSTRDTRAESAPATEAARVSPAAEPAGAEAPIPLATALGVTFVDGSTSTVIVEREGKRYLIDLTTQSVAEADPTVATVPVESLKPAETSRTESQQTPSAQAPPKDSNPKVYEPADDYVFTLPTGRRLDRHAFHINFNHRFVAEPAFHGPAKGDTLLGLDSFSISSFGFRFGLTDKLSASIYRSPTYVSRPIELLLGYSLLDERDGHPFNATVRFSVDGQDNFTQNFSYNFEGIVSRSITSRAQFYVVPTVTLSNRRLIAPPYPNPIPNLPGVDTFSLGAALAVDIRPTVALLAEVNPTLVGGPELGIHRPAFAFGVQKRTWGHAFTFGFTNSPGTTVAQRSGTRATYLGDPSADKINGLFVAFDLTRRIR